MPFRKKIINLAVPIQYKESASKVQMLRSLLASSTSYHSFDLLQALRSNKTLAYLEDSLMYKKKVDFIGKSCSANLNHHTNKEFEGEKKGN